MEIPKTPCQIPELKLSCWGCCGNNFKSREKVERDIEQNTIDFNEIILDESTEEKLIEFRDRYDGYDLSPSGLCLNLIEFESGCLACPLHKMINKIVSERGFNPPKNDLRIIPCDVNYECKTFKLWKIFPQSQKKEYINWLIKERKSLNHYNYSLGNHDGVFIEKYLKERNQIIQ